MATSAPTRSKGTANHDLSQLRAEIRTLGIALGRVIERMEGKPALETVETLRKLAKAARAGDAEAEKALSKAVKTLSPREAFNQAMAFTLYFELVNLAEENFRVQLLRQRRRERLQNQGSTEAKPIRESIEAAIAELKSRGVTTDEMQRLVDSIEIELVFTAHPTESKRRTLLAKLQRLAGILRQAHQSDGADPQSVEREIASLWLTDRSRTERPEVADEARTGLWYLDTTLYTTLPRLQEDMERALQQHYPDVVPPSRWLTFGSWIGGDRDGNPNVTAEVTEQIVLLHRRLAAEKLRQSVYDLSRSLTVSDRREPLPAVMKRALRENRYLSETIAQLSSRYPHEPYRLLLAGLRERLGQAAERATKKGELIGKKDSGALTTEAVCETLQAIHDGLKAGRGVILTGGELKTVRQQADIFGLHAARLDIRQHSGPHEAAMAELLGKADYAKKKESEKVALLTEAIEHARPLSDQAIAALSPATRHVVEPVRLTGLIEASLGRGALGIYIISMTDDVSDVLEVQYLMAVGGGAQLPIAPLFETLDDLERAPQVLRSLFAQPIYARRLAAQDNLQYVMLGYSDSNKDCGYLTANWALYQAQENIAKVCVETKVALTLFHGRGGSIARGGGPAAKAILAQPIGLRDGGIRVTEQGEVLSTRYHDADLAHRILEQMAYGVILGIDAAKNPLVPPSTWTEAMDTMSKAGFAAYEALVHHDKDFLTFWKQATPIDEISNLKLGSRPTFRRNTTSVEDLRAIPWVFSWMQTRFVFPGWFGLGSALQSVLKRGPAGKKLLREMHAKWPFFQTLIDNAQLTLRKTDLGIARLYAGLVEDGRIRERILRILEDEFAATEAAILAVTGQKQLLANEPVLLNSVQLRNPYIDPLNYIQVEMMRRLRSGKLSKEEEDEVRGVIELTINGISGGLKNTG